MNGLEGLPPEALFQTPAGAPEEGADAGGALQGREATVIMASKIVRELINEVGIEGVMEMIQSMGAEAGIDTSEAVAVAAEEGAV